MTKGAETRSLDYATRKLIADTVRDSVHDAIGSEAMSFQLHNEIPALTHGPCSLGCEALVIGAVLLGDIPILAIPLQPDDFWSREHKLFWLSLRATSRERGFRGDSHHWFTRQAMAERAVAYLDNRGMVTGPLDYLLEDLEALRERAIALAAFRDVASATLIILEHARARRLNSLMFGLIHGICNGSESHGTAYAQLRDHFAAERGPLVKP